MYTKRVDEVCKRKFMDKKFLNRIMPIRTDSAYSKRLQAHLQLSPSVAFPVLDLSRRQAPFAKISTRKLRSFYHGPSR